MDSRIILIPEGSNADTLKDIAKELTDILTEKGLSYLEAITVTEIAQEQIGKCKIIK